MGFSTISNTAIKLEQQVLRGNIDGGIIQGVASMLGDFTIPAGIYLNYAMNDQERAYIKNGRIYGYFEGYIEGLDNSLLPDDKESMANGDL